MFSLPPRRREGPAVLQGPELEALEYALEDALDDAVEDTPAPSLLRLQGPATSVQPSQRPASAVEPLPSSTALSHLRLRDPRCCGLHDPRYCR